MQPLYCQEIGPATVKIILFANTEWYLFNFRLSLAKALQTQGY